MRQLSTGEPVWDLQFDENGQLTSPAQGDVLAEVAAAGVTDLFAFSHGWGASQDSARSLYDQMFPMIRNAAQGLAGLPKIGFAGIYWPSLWFPPTPATPASTAGAAQSDDAKQQQLRQISQLVKSLTPPPADGGYEDAGETALLLTSDPVDDYQATADVFGSAPSAGSQQGIADWFDKAVNGAKDVMRVFSYTTMKARAGTVGQNGVGPLLAALHAQSPAVRVHLIGHSFGARLVSFALAGVGTPDGSPVASLLLLQGAFSHWSFAHAQDNPFGSPGALNAYADRVHGPLVATHTVYDWAVGVWYPKASFLAQQDAQAVVADRWGGMGSDGFQAVKPSQDQAMPAQGGTRYGLAPGTFYRIDCAAVINNTAGEPFSGAHSDIRKPPVAQLAAAAAAAHA